MAWWNITGAVKGITDLASKVVGIVAPDKTKKLEFENKLKTIALTFAQDGKMSEFKDIQQSRLMYSRELERSPWLIRLLNGLVRPLGGIGALFTVFWVIWSPYFGYPQLSLPDLSWDNPIWAMISGIISFFFVLRHRAQTNGVKDK